MQNQQPYIITILTCGALLCLLLQRTNKSFNARRWCGSRTYEYYLPAAALQLETADGSSSSDQQKLTVFKEVLQQYCGYKAFHNYAGNRRQYVGQKAKGVYAVTAVGEDCYNLGLQGCIYVFEGPQWLCSVVLLTISNLAAWTQLLIFAGSSRPYVHGLTAYSR